VVLDSIINAGIRGIVFEGTGLGHVSERLFDSIKSAISEGVSVAMASQTLYGRVNMNVYSTGRRLLELGVISCGDMLPETAYIKLMWVLAHSTDTDTVGDLMRSNLAGELNEKSVIL
jgi:glutamyl-tRNA(Gln) amidotransferase subunit D